MKYTTDIEQFYKRRNRRLKRRGSDVRFDYARPSEDYDWITINGVHTPIDDNGNISGGAGGKFNGKKYTGSKMQRSKKRTERVGTGTKKVGVADIKGKGLAKKVQAYMDSHGGEMPDKNTMHSYSYSEYKKARNALEKAREEYSDKYLGVENLVERIERINNNSEWNRISLERWEKTLKEAQTEDDTAEATEEVEYYKDRIAKNDEKVEELKRDPNYTRHEKDYKRVAECARDVKRAMEDNAQFMFNKGSSFKSPEEVGAYLDASGWFEPITEDDIINRRMTRAYIGDMNINFAVSVADAVDSFGKDFPKMKEVCRSIGTGNPGNGIVGYYSDGSHDIEFSDTYVSKERYAEEKRDYQASVRSGHFPKGTDIGSSAHHEFTHAMENRMQRDDKKNVLDGKSPSTVVLERVQDKLNDHSIFFKEKVSRYAAKEYPAFPEWKDAEFLAEAMSEAYTSKAPRDIARAVREEFTKLYHEIYD